MPVDENKTCELDMNIWEATGWGGTVTDLTYAEAFSWAKAKDKETGHKHCVVFGEVLSSRKEPKFNGETRK